MQLWVGLGNPGAQYAMHRHNVGFMAVDAIAEVHGFGPVKKAFQGWTQEGRIAGEKILLLKPATFMNESGRAVGDAELTIATIVAPSALKSTEGDTETPADEEASEG